MSRHHVGRMASPVLDQSPFMTERRGSARVKVSVEAHLQTAAANWRGTLCDISETGARMLIARPPIAGATALLRWQEHETLCRVVWATDDMCGLQFERPIPLAAVRESAQCREGPRPTLGNIPLGQRRARPT